MAEETNQELLKKAKAFFDRAEQVEATDNFDYAISMYVEGLRRAPDAIEDGHIPLRHMSFIRQAKGGKKPSMMDKMKYRGGKSALDQMLNAEFLLAKDPDNLEYIQAMIKAAIAGGYVKTAEWMADILFDACRADKRENPQVFILLKDAYSKLELYDKAVQACSYAVKLKPADAALSDELRYLSANMAMRKGRYEEEGDFRKMIKDRQGQEKLQAQEAVVKTQDYRIIAVQDARKALEADAQSTEKIRKLANALADLEHDKSFEEAIKLLEENYVKLRDFSLKKLAGELQIKRFKTLARKTKAKIEADSKDDKSRQEFRKISDNLLKIEIEHFKLCVENYPTDAKMKFEYGSRLIQTKQYDQAIPVLQEASQDPKNKIAAMDKLGVCFFNKGWYTDAIDIFQEAIKSYEFEDDAVAKDLRYNLARSFEQDGDLEQALAIYRKLAQLDYSYKDVRIRVDKLRAKGNGKNGNSQSTSQ
jgi:tetratricopeptide (TPR) repeat protein